jgi:hypothetical protein
MSTRTKTLGMTALLAASTSVAAVAQTAPEEGGSPTEPALEAAPEVGMTPDTAAPGMTSGAPDTFSELVSIFEEGMPEMADPAVIDTGYVIDTLTLSDIPDQAAGESESLDLALADVEGELAAMQDEIAANDMLADLLEAQGFAAEDVIGIFSAAPDRVELLVDDRA